MADAETFTDIFLSQFTQRATLEGKAFAKLWHGGGPTWTQLMLGDAINTNAVLWQTAKHWAGADSSLHFNWYTIDLLAVRPAYVGSIPYWKTRAHLLIEHENGKDIETELWKLAHWRARLKVLVFYRFGDQAWLDAKLAFADNIIGQTTDAEEYLLLAGALEDGCIIWKAHAWDGKGRRVDRTLSTNVRL